MADQGFPGQHTTTTTMTATSTTVQTDIRYDPLYLRTLPGMLKVAQIGEVERPAMAKRPRQNGAQRKRYKWLLDQGHSREEASKLCLRPMPSKGSEDNNKLLSVTPLLTIKDQGQREPRTGIEVGLKRPLSDKPTPPWLVNKNQRFNEPRLKEDEVKRGTHNQKTPKAIFTDGIRVGILPENFPENELSSDQMDSIKEAILDLIIKEEDKTVHPSFYSINKHKGFFVVICNNQETADWLKAKQTDLVPWEGAKLKAVFDQELPRFLTANLSHCVKDSTEKILKYLENQNEGLKATSWKILRREEKGDNVFLSVVVDAATAYRLELNDFWVSFKFGKAQVKPTKPNKQSVDEKKAEASTGEVKELTEHSITSLSILTEKEKQMNLRQSSSVDEEQKTTAVIPFLTKEEPVNFEWSEY